MIKPVTAIDDSMITAWRKGKGGTFEFPIDRTFDGGIIGAPGRVLVTRKLDATELKHSCTGCTYELDDAKISPCAKLTCVCRSDRLNVVIKDITDDAPPQL